MPLVQAALMGAKKGLIAEDRFDRPDAGALGAADSGQVWTQFYGGGGIVSSDDNRNNRQRDKQSGNNQPGEL